MHPGAFVFWDYTGIRRLGVGICNITRMVRLNNAIKRISQQAIFGIMAFFSMILLNHSGKITKRISYSLAVASGLAVLLVNQA